MVVQDVDEVLAGPLGGMGTAFSASLLGLSGSLILGFLDLQASQAQNAFVRVSSCAWTSRPMTGS